jgi:hypothetical protein
MSNPTLHKISVYGSKELLEGIETFINSLCADDILSDASDDEIIEKEFKLFRVTAICEVKEG